jgi:hypothetical protein
LLLICIFSPWSFFFSLYLFDSDSSILFVIVLDISPPVKMSAELSLEDLQDEVLKKLQLLDVAQLGEVCVQLSITVPVAKKGKKTATRSFILNHLTSDAVEEDEEIFKSLNERLVQMVGDNKDNAPTEVSTVEVVKAEDGEQLKSNMSSNTSSSSAAGADSRADDHLIPVATGGGNVVTKVELARFRDWKVSAGTFGGTNHVDYCSLSYQVAEANDLKYSEREIVSGMIKAMKDPLKKHCEAKRSWTLKDLMKRIRSYAKVKNSDDMMDDLKLMKQEPTEVEIDFLTRLTTARDNIVAVSANEDHPKSLVQVQKKFLRTLAVGFRQDTIRLMLAPVCKQVGLDDDTLMDEVNNAVEADKENKSKTRGGKSAASNSLNVESYDPVVVAPVVAGGAGNEAILAELKRLTGAVKELDVLKDNVRVLEGRLNSMIPGGGASHLQQQQSTTPKFVKCPACEVSGAYCRHCSFCGKDGHRRRACPDDPKNP